jgi:mannose-6-phosphate isomerase
MKDLPLYPLKFYPILQQKVWGGNKLKQILGKNEASKHCGESWEISGLKDNISVVKNGFLADNNLTEIIEIYMEDLLGPKIYDLFGTTFPLLIKFIDASDNLSVQVHPNNEIAREKHQSFGKTEAWYIMDADTDAFLISGFKQNISKNEFIARLNNNKILPVLNKTNVKSGELYHIPAGRIHAAGKGILFAEIQQASDITYRIYDWDRTSMSGESRELHLDLALDALDFSEVKRAQTPYVLSKNQPTRLLRNDFFTLNLIYIDQPINKSYTDCQSFVVYLCVEGNTEIITETTTLTLTKGESLLIPYEILEVQINPKNTVKIIEIFIEIELDDNEMALNTGD